MRIQKSKVKSQNWLVLACSLALLLTCSLLFAGETGKVVGRVQDQGTGEAVAGAAVEIEGTELGEATDENGRFSILSVPAGTWSVTVSGGGFHHDDQDRPAGHCGPDHECGFPAQEHGHPD